MIGLTTVTINRYTLDSFDEFGQVEISGPTSTFTVRASVQPLGGRVLDHLPEGAALAARFVMYVGGNPDIQTGGETDSTLADFAIWRGREYEIKADEDWRDHQAGIPHRAYLLLEVGQNESP